MEAIQRRWKFKLGLDDGFEFNETIDIKKRHPKDITDEELAKCELGPGVTVATARLYLEKVSPFMVEAYSKNVFLDDCIERLYLDCEAKRVAKHEEIVGMKKAVEKLEEIAEIQDAFGEDGAEA